MPPSLRYRDVASTRVQRAPKDTIHGRGVGVRDDRVRLTICLEPGSFGGRNARRFGSGGKRATKSSGSGGPLGRGPGRGHGFAMAALGSTTSSARQTYQARIGGVHPGATIYDIASLFDRGQRGARPSRPRLTGPRYPSTAFIAGPR